MSLLRVLALYVALGLTALALVATADWLFVIGTHRTSPEAAYAYSATALTWWLGYFGWRR